MRISSIVFLLITTLILAFPASYEPHHFAKVLLAGSLVQSFAYSCILLALTYRSVVLKRIVFSLLYFLFCIESFLYITFGSRLDPNMLSLMLQTTLRETKEFISVYLISPSAFVFLLLASVCYIFIYKFLGNNNPSKLPSNWITKSLACLFIIIGLSLPYLPIQFLGKNTVNRLVDSVSFVTERHSETDSIAKSIDKIVITQTPKKEGAPTIVLIIGESYNKQHSSLYGYTLSTTPNMEKERLKGNLVCYAHAISPTNRTDNAIRLLFTLKGCEKADKNDVRQYILMPAVFKKAQYNVRYFDNQYTKLSGGSFDYSCGYFLNPTYINDNCFDYRNTETKKYDGDFVSYYKTSFLSKPKSLNIIHLMGQHFDAALRYPDSFNRYTIQDIKREDLTEGQRKQVAEYDNAVYYNDYVIKNIIDIFRNTNAVIIYLSDHGEQIYDKPHCYFGRDFGSIKEEETYKAIYEVPFMIWCSNKFIEKNEDIYNTIKERNSEKICIADIPYLLFDIAGIDFNYNIKSRSIIDKRFTSHKTHLLTQ